MARNSSAHHSNHHTAGARSWLWSAVAVGAMAVLLHSLLDWHHSTRPVTVHTQRLLLLQQQQPPPAEQQQDAPTIDDDFTRDETCREYLVNFLNGTTDAKDECQGFYNAWKAADCQDDSNLSDLDVAWYFILDIFGIGRRHRNDNGTVVEDDVVIDDYYENWECCSSISDFYGKHCKQAELDAFKLLGITLVLVVCGAAKSLIRVLNLRWIAGAYILVGSIVGGLLRLINPEVVKDKLSFDNDLFLQILLPPIIFEAAISIDKRAFRRDLFPILTLAVFGTGFSALGIGYITYKVSSWGSGAALPLLDSLLFGALMSSIDPVATLSILSGVGVNQGDTLYTLVFGESLLNDGVAIVLFNSLVKYTGDANVVDVATVHATLLDFLIVISGSILIGFFCGAACTFYYWALQGQFGAVTEVALFFAWALIPYYIADGFGYSGIISIMVGGFTMDYFVIGGFQSEDNEWMEYMRLRVRPSEDGHHPVQPTLERFKDACRAAFSGRGHISTRSRNHVGFVAEVISNLMETAIFAYLGLFLFNDRVVNFKMIASGILSCVSSRAAMIILVSLLINFCVFIDLEGMLGRLWYMFRRSNSRITLDDNDTSFENNERVYLDKKTQLILFSAGVRGAVSYALVQNIPVYDAVTKHGSEFKSELRAMTSTTIVVLLFSFGALTYFTVHLGASQSDREHAAAGPLHQRLMSMGLDSQDGLPAGGSYEESSDLELEEELQPQNIRPPTAR